MHILIHIQRDSMLLKYHVGQQGLEGPFYFYLLIFRKTTKKDRFHKQRRKASLGYLQES